MASLSQGGEFDIVIYQGATFRKTFKLRDATTGAVVPLTGYTSVAAQLRESEVDSSTTLATFTGTVDAAQGEVTIELTPTDTTALTAKKGFYDVFVISPTDRIMLVEGKAKINPRTTVAP
jgi:hypothetical protein